MNSQMTLYDVSLRNVIMVLRCPFTGSFLSPKYNYALLIKVKIERIRADSPC